MAYLRSRVNDKTTSIPVDAAIVGPTYPAFYTIDAETIKVLAGADTTRWVVERGVAESIAAPHAAGVALVAVDAPFGAGGGLPTGWTVDTTTLVANGGALKMGDGAGIGGGPIGTEGGAIDTLGGMVRTGGGNVDTEGGNVVVAAGTIDGSGGAVELVNLVSVVLACAGDANISMANTGAVTISAGGAALDELKLGTYNAENAIRILDFDGAGALRMGFFAAAPVARPQVPASPTAQDVVTALVTLGLITQAV